MENAPPPPQGREKIIEDLARQWVPTIADNLRQLFHEREVNQAELFGRCLLRLRDYLAGSRSCPEDFVLVPENRCPVFSEKQRWLGLMAAQNRKGKPPAETRALLEELDNQRLAH